MKATERLFRFLADLMRHKFYGSVIIRLEAGKVTHVETETRRTWQYKDLPEEPGVREGRDGCADLGTRSVEAEP